MKKTITALTLISLSIGVGMSADVNISAADLTEGEYNYIAIPQGENSTVVIDGLKEDQSLASVKRLYIGESLTGGDYTYGNISISVDNLKITERLYSFPFMDGAGTVSMGDIVFNVGSNVSSVQTYLGGQSWYSGSKYIVNSITGTFNGNNSAHATAGVMTGAGDSVSINNGVKFYMTDANAYIRWMYVGGYNQNSSVTNIKGGTWAEISDGSIGKNLTGSIAGGVYNYNGASSRIEGGTHITITGGSHGDVYGGDQVDGGSSSYIDNTHIVMTGGSASTIFGGSLLYANSNNISQIGDDGSASNAIVIDFGGTASAARIVGGSYNDSNADGTSKATINGNIEINVNGGTVGDIIAGGMGENVFVNGNSTVNLSGPAVVSGDIYGCGVNGATLSGQSTLNIGTSTEGYVSDNALSVIAFDKINVSANSNAKISSITQDLSGEVLGSRTTIAKGGALEVTGDITNNIVDGTNTGSFVGGLTGGDAIVDGAVKTTIDGENTSLHFVYGGNGGNQQTVLGMTRPIGESKVGSVDLVVNNGKIDMIVGSGAMYSDVDSDVNITINGGDVTDIYGSASGAKIGGNVNIKVENTSVGSITAGGCGTYGEPSVINGSTNIWLGDGAVVRTDIYGGGWGDGASWPTVVKSGSNITLVGNAAVNGVIYGGGMDPTYDVVEGEKVLNIGTSSQAYTGNGTVKAADLDKINVYKDANITFDGIVATNDAKMQICRGYAGDSTATITVKNAKYNNLTGDYPTRAPFDMAFINISDNSILNVESSEFNGNDISASTGAFINGSVWSGVANNSVVNINSVSFADNNITATKTADNSNTGIQYGMIYGNTVNVDASEFTGNKISSVSEVEGVGTSLYGGLIGAKNLSITGSKFVGNEAAQTSSGATGLNIYGGLLWSSTGKTLTIKSSEFSGNKSVASCGITGGVIFENGGITEISDTSFNGNSAIAQGYKSRGGAVANYNGVMTLNNVSFDGNYAETASSTEFAQGGALYARNYSDGKSTTLNNVVFSNNSVKNGMGGAIFVEGSNITINATQNAIMSGNVAMDREGNVSDANGGFLYLENYNGTRPASAAFNIGQDATYIVGSGISGYDSIASGDSSAVITKDGLGSLTVNGSMDYFTGTLNVNEGVMNANSGLGASAISIASGAILEVRVNGQNALSNSALTSAKYSNSGTLAISAKAGLAAGDYTVSAGNITDYGNVAVFGGTLNGNIFTAADTNAISLDTAVEPIVVSDNGRVAVVTDDSVAKIEMAFNSQEAVVNKVETVTDDLLSVVNPEEVSIVEAYSFDVAMNEEDTVLLSFLVGDSSLTVEDFVIFHRGETGEWEQANDIYSLSYDGEYLSFIVSHFSDYGYAAIPEPATYALFFGIAALVMAMRRRRK